MALQKNLSWSNVKKYVLDIFFPNRCPFCGRIIKWNESCCDKCNDAIPYINTEYCKKCGKENCMCNEVELYYNGCVSVSYYSGIIKNGILKFKLDKATNLVDVFENDIYKRLCELLDINDIDVITSVPMNKSSKRERGYNQAEIIAKLISKRIKKPMISDILIKSKDDIIQHELSRKERAISVKGLFKANDKFINKIKGKTVLLCDDIITTGSTLNECAYMLKQHGAKAVYCITIASTQLRSNKL